MSLINNTDENTRSIEVLIRALGTMVMEPEYRSDPNNVGQKILVTTVQKPIFEGEDRKIISDKLIELVKAL